MPNVPPTHAAHTWAVTGHQEEPSFDDNGKPTTLHHVSFKTNTGHESSITLPDSHFTARNVAEQIHHKAQEIIRVYQMNSTNTPKAE